MLNINIPNKLSIVLFLFSSSAKRQVDPDEVAALKETVAELKETLHGLVRKSEKEEEDKDAEEYLREVEEFGSQMMETDDSTPGN